MAVAVSGVSFVAAASSAQAVVIGSEGGFTYTTNSSKLATSPPDSPQAREVEARCPNGEVPAGGGNSVSGDPLSSYVSATGPLEKSWLAGGWHVDVPRSHITAWAICTQKRSKVRVSTEVAEAVAGGTAGSAAPTCAKGSVVSGGVRPESGIQEWWLNTSYPQDGGADADDKPDDAWLSAIWHLPGFFPPVDVAIDAVCMKDTKPSYKVQGVAFSTDDVISQSVRCPRTKTAVGGGPSVSGPASQSHVARTRPLDSDDKGEVPDDGWEITVANPTMAEMDVVVWVACV